MSSEIIDDIRVSTLEIASESGLNLSNFDSRLKHTGAGTFTLTSTSTLDNAISIDLPNGGLDVNVQKTIDFKALDSTETAITLQGLTGGIEINAYRNIQLTSENENINIDTQNGNININSERSLSDINNSIPGVHIISNKSKMIIEALSSGISGYINTDLVLYSDSSVIIDTQGISGIQIGTQYTVPISVGTTENLTTINGDLTVSGNFKVDGYSVQNNVTVFTSEDPVFYLNTGISGTNNTNDIGFIGKRGNLENVGWMWKESADEWVAIGTDSNGVDNIDNDVNDYKPARFGGLNVVTDTSRGSTATVFNVDVNGQINLETGLTNLDAITVTSAGGIDITASGVTKDIDITATGSVNITSNEGAIDGIVLTSSGGIDINTVSGTDITNTGSSTALVVNQNGTGQDVAVFKDNGITALIVKDGGTVGVNKTNPGYPLDVNGTANATSVYQAGFMLVPPGAMMPYAASIAPGGWLLCDGLAVSRSTYSALFALIGSTYGNGDGESTFNLPNLKGRTIVGFNSTDGNYDAIGETGGSKTVTLTTNELPSHSHTGTTNSSGSHTHSITDPGHKHTITTINDDFNSSGASPPGFAADSAGTRTWDIMSTNMTGITINSDGAHTHTFTTASAGSGNSFSILNPYITLNYIIKY